MYELHLIFKRDARSPGPAQALCRPSFPGHVCSRAGTRSRFPWNLASPGGAPGTRLVTEGMHLCNEPLDQKPSQPWVSPVFAALLGLPQPWGAARLPTRVPSGRRQTGERSWQALLVNSGPRGVLISAPESEDANIESPSQFPTVILVRRSFSQRESEMLGILAKHADAQGLSDLRSHKLENWGQAGRVPQLVPMQVPSQRGVLPGERPRRPHPTTTAAPTSLARNSPPTLGCARHPGLLVRTQSWWV